MRPLPADASAIASAKVMVPSATAATGPLRATEPAAPTASATPSAAASPRPPIVARSVPPRPPPGTAPQPLLAAPIRASPPPRPGSAEGWEDGKTTIDDEPPARPALAQPQPQPEPESHDDDDDEEARRPTRPPASASDDVGNSTIDEPTVDDHARQLPSLALVRPVAPALVLANHKTTAGKLVVTAGNDQGRQFELREQNTSIGRGVDNDVVLTDIAVSRHHLEIMFDGKMAYTLRDRGSGNGTLVNERIEDGSCQLRHGDRIEIGNTIFRFEHTAAAAEPLAAGWGQRPADDEDEIATTAGRTGARTGSGRAAAMADPSARAASRTGTGNDLASRATIPPPPRASSTRLGLPALPPGASAADPGAPEPGAAPARPVGFTIESSLQRPGGPMSMTMAVQPYPRRLPDQDRKLVLGLVAGCAGLIVLGLVVMLISGNERAPARPLPPAAHGVAPESNDVAPDATGVTREPTAPTAPAPADEARPDVAAPAPSGDQLPTGDEPTIATPPEPPPEPKAAAVVDKSPPSVDKKPDVADKKPAPPVVDKKPAVADKRPAPPVAGKVSPAAAKKKAAAQYAGKDFRGAAATLHTAGETASRGDADDLDALASTYEAVGASLSEGESSTNPTGALTALNRALSLDKKVGGALAASIREKIAAVAPKAAGSYMAKGKYEDARRAADTAVNFGSGGNPTVAQVRKSLERKAGELFASGTQAAKKNKADEAKALWRRVLKIVPDDSPWFAKATKALE